MSEREREKTCVTKEVSESECRQQCCPKTLITMCTVATFFAAV